ADVEAKLKAAEAEQRRLQEEVQRQAKAAADAEAKRKAAEAEQQRLKEEVQRQAKAAADAEAKRKAAEAEQQGLAARADITAPAPAPKTAPTPPRLPSDDRLIRTFTGHSRSVVSVAFSPDDGRTALSGSDDQSLKLWEVATGKVLRTLTDPG